MESKQSSRAEDIGLGICMFVAGILLFLMPIVTWSNSKFFAVLYSPGLLLGPFMVYAGASLAWDGIRGQGDGQ